MLKPRVPKTKVYSRYAVKKLRCAKSGGPDPDANLQLRSGLIEKSEKKDTSAKCSLL